MHGIASLEKLDTAKKPRGGKKKGDLTLGLLSLGGNRHTFTRGGEKGLFSRRGGKKRDTTAFLEGLPSQKKRGKIGGDGFAGFSPEGILPEACRPRREKKRGGVRLDYSCYARNSSSPQGHYKRKKERKVAVLRPANLFAQREGKKSAAKSRDS